MMIKDRLVSAIAALALAMAQIGPAAARQTPNVGTPPANDNSSSTADTRWVSAVVADLKTYVLGLLQQNYTLRVPSAAALRRRAGFSGAVVARSGFSSPGDGGAATYAFNAAACRIDDGGSCLDAAAGGSWRIDWSSVNNTASECLFENAPASSDDTAALQAAIATGKRVRFCKTQVNLTSDITTSTANQIVEGNGRDYSYVVALAPGGFKKGVFVDTPSVPTTFRNFSIYAVQPRKAATVSALDRYPPLFYSRDNGRANFDHIGCYLGTICIDARGNSGGMSIDELRFNAFSIGIALDGSEDTVRLRSLQWYPFLMSSQQQSLFFAQGSGAPIGISSGRMDDLDLEDSLFIGGQAVSTFLGTGTYGSGEAGPTFGTFANVDFDTFSGIAMNTGNISCAACLFTLSNTAAQSINLHNGARLHCAACQLGIGAAIARPAIQVDGANNPRLTWVGGELSYQAFFDVTAVQVGDTSNGGGQINISGTSSSWPAQSNQAKSKPVIAVLGTGARASVVDNQMGDYGSGGGTFLSFAADNFNVERDNVIPGWGVTRPSGSPLVGIYGPDVKLPSGPN